jgi:hypothetical protein
VKRTKLVAAEEKYRVALYRTLELLLAEAERQARKGKPALLRILTRAAGRGPKSHRVEDAGDADAGPAFDWTGTPWEEKIRSENNGSAVTSSKRKKPNGRDPDDEK